MAHLSNDQASALKERRQVNGVRSPASPPAVSAQSLLSQDKLKAGAKQSGLQKNSKFSGREWPSNVEVQFTVDYCHSLKSGQSQTGTCVDTLSKKHFWKEYKLRDDSNVQQRYQQEVDALKRLGGKMPFPALFASNDSDMIIVMSNIDGRDLGPARYEEHQKQKSFDFSLNSVISAFSQLLKAVSQMHTNDILHRDIKPENLIWDKDKHLWVVDLGICWFSNMQPPVSITRDGEAIGPGSFLLLPEYEGASMDKHDQRSDVAMCCAIFIDLLRPWSNRRGGDRSLEALVLSLSADKHLLSALTNSGAPVYDVLLKGLSVDLKQRHNSIQDLQVDFTNAMRGFDIPPTGRPSAPLKVSSSWWNVNLIRDALAEELQEGKKFSMKTSARIRELRFLRSEFTNVQGNDVTVMLVLRGFVIDVVVNEESPCTIILYGIADCPALQRALANVYQKLLASP